MNIKKDVNIKNKRATFDYAISDTFTAGIVLTGTEIKSIRLGKASLADTFCYVDRGEVWIKNMYIAATASSCSTKRRSPNSENRAKKPASQSCPCGFSSTTADSQN